jgi:hypothetical protein
MAKGGYAGRNRTKDKKKINNSCVRPPITSGNKGAQAGNVTGKMEGFSRAKLSVLTVYANLAGLSTKLELFEKYLGSRKHS